MTVTSTKLTPTSFAANDEDRERIKAIGEMLERRGYRVMRGGNVSASAVISYALHRVFLAECSTDGSLITDRNAA